MEVCKKVTNDWPTELFFDMPLGISDDTGNFVNLNS